MYGAVSKDTTMEVRPFKISSFPTRGAAVSNDLKDTVPFPKIITAQRCGGFSKNSPTVIVMIKHLRTHNTMTTSLAPTMEWRKILPSYCRGLEVSEFYGSNVTVLQKQTSSREATIQREVATKLNLRIVD